METLVQLSEPSDSIQITIYTTALLSRFCFLRIVGNAFCPIKNVRIFHFYLISIFLISCKAGNQKPSVTEKPILENRTEDSAKVIKNPGDDDRFASRNLIIFYDEKIGNEALSKAVEDFDAVIISRYNALKGIAIRIPDNKSIEAAIIYFKNVKGVTSVSRDRIYRLDPPIRQLD